MVTRLPEYPTLAEIDARLKRERAAMLRPGSHPSEYPTLAPTAEEVTRAPWLRRYTAAGKADEVVEAAKRAAEPAPTKATKNWPPQRASKAKAPWRLKPRRSRNDPSAAPPTIASIASPTPAAPVSTEATRRAAMAARALEAVDSRDLPSYRAILVHVGGRRAVALAVIQVLHETGRIRLVGGLFRRGHG